MEKRKSGERNRETLSLSRQLYGSMQRKPTTGPLGDTVQLAIPLLGLSEKRRMYQRKSGFPTRWAPDSSVKYVF